MPEPSQQPPPISTREALKRSREVLVVVVTLLLGVVSTLLADQDGRTGRFWSGFGVGMVLGLVFTLFSDGIRRRCLSHWPSLRWPGSFGFFVAGYVAIIALSVVFAMI